MGCLYGRPVTIDSVNLTYDAFGKMVEQNRSGTYTQIVYSPNGQKMQTMNGQASTMSIVALPGGGQAVFSASGLLYYGHPDHLGSTRFASTPSRTMYFDTAYAPFGEPYAQSGTADLSFTGRRQDTVAGLYDFPAREYSYQGRWPSPDPAGLAAVDPSNPQSWNRYAYVMNEPLLLVDPAGLCGTDFQQTYTNGVLQVGPASDYPCPGLQPWLTITNFACVFFGTCNSGGGGSPSGGAGGGGSSTGGTSSTTVKTVLRKIGNYVPVVCGGGVFNYAGITTSGPLSVGVSPHFQQADFGLDQGKPYSAYSEGVFVEASAGKIIQGGVGQAHTYGYGQTLANSKTTETFLFGGLGTSEPFAGASASLFYATPSSFGINLEGSLLAFKGGVGGYVNVSSLTACVGF